MTQEELQTSAMIASRLVRAAVLVMTRVLWCRSPSHAVSHSSKPGTSGVATGATLRVPVTLLVALKDGQLDHRTLLAWSDFGARIARAKVLIPFKASARSGEILSGYPHIELLSVQEQAPWSDILSRVVETHKDSVLFGLAGEGSLPHEALRLSALKGLVGLLMARKEDPVAIMSRAEAGDGARTWLPDSFMPSVWANRAFFLPERLSAAGLQHLSVEDTTLLRVISLLVSQNDTICIDGTTYLPSSYSTVVTSAYNASVGGRVQVTAGTVELYLFAGSEEGGASHYSIDHAPWPRPYVLETVATSTGLVIVTNVNCGYLDMATNFIRSVQRTSGVQVWRGFPTGECTSGPFVRNDMTTC